MNKRILVIGKDLNYNLEYFMTRAFRRDNNEVKFIGFANVLRHRNYETLRMLWARSKFFRDASIPFFLQRVNDTYLKIAREFNPDIVFSIKGESVLPNYVNKIRKEVGSKIVLWYPDDPRFFTSLSRHIAPSYDVIFTCSQRATDLYRSIEIEKVHRLPFACDPELHVNDFNAHEKTRKALFIGSFSPKRYKLIKKLISMGTKIDIIGSNWPPSFFNYVVSKAILGQQYVSALQSYSVILNIHQDILYGPNMRTFEATGSGALLLSDAVEDINTFFSPNREILLYETAEEAFEKINQTLEGEETNFDMVIKAYKKCHEKYTYDIRVKEVLRTLI